MSFTSLLNPEEYRPSHPTLRLFKWPAILTGFTALSFCGIAAGGIGSCGGPGLFFIPFFLGFGIASLIAWVYCIAKEVKRRRASVSHPEQPHNDERN